MKISIEIPEFNSNDGIRYNWEDGFIIETKYENNSICITANREGLLSLANHLLNLAQSSVPIGYHLHFDEHNSLEEGSVELVIEKR